MQTMFGFAAATACQSLFFLSFSTAYYTAVAADWKGVFEYAQMHQKCNFLKGKWLLLLSSPAKRNSGGLCSRLSHYM